MKFEKFGTMFAERERELHIQYNAHARDARKIRKIILILPYPATYFFRKYGAVFFVSFFIFNHHEVHLEVMVTA